MSVDDSTTQLDKISLCDGVEEAQFSQRVPVRSILGRPDGGAGLAGKVVKIGGWVKTGREQGKGSFAFLEVNDGSCPANLQVIVDSAVYKLGDLVPTGTCVHVEGELKLPPEGAKQKVELRVQKVLSVGTVDAGKYPLPKTKLTLEFLRDVVHLRPRTNTISAVARIRNALAYATHTFFQKNGFLYIHTPIITTSDCEGAGEMFQVTTLISEAEKLEKELKVNPAPSDSDIKVVEQLVKEKGEAVARLKADKASTEKAGSNIADINKQIGAAVGDLTRAKENLLKLQERFKLGERVKCSAGIPKKDGNIDYTDDFFARQAFLTVSGQLQVETYACALSSVYTFGPTFRAEQSHTSRHLAEFWMVEPEIAFADLKDDMNCAEAYVKFLCQWLLEHCLDDMEFITKFIDKGALGRLRMVTSSKFHRLTYTEAIAILEEASKTKTFENKVEWGIDLASEHERYLTEEHFKSPVIVFNYPKDIKAFYMKVNEDNKTVAAMDLLVPKVGELIGGSQREEDYEVLRSRISDMGLPLEPYEWYLDLRAARALALLPLAGLAAWSGNATLLRMQHQVRAPPGGEAFEFIPGSMDDTIMETLETGDLVFFQRKLTAMQPLAALHTWVTRLQLRPRFDHCGWVYVDRLGRKFIVEETLNKVQCRPYSARILTSEATEISVLTLKLERSKEMQEAANAFIAENLGRTSRISLRQTVSALINPEEMRKTSPDATPSFPCAAFVAEAYDAMGLVNKNQLSSNRTSLSAATVTPRDLAASKIKLQVPPEKQSDGAKPPAFGRLLPIRLE